MTDKYEYHKQNDYPGERTAERKRVAEREDAAEKVADERVAEKGRIDGLRADNRVARKGRMDDRLLDDEMERSAARARRTARSRDVAGIIGIVVVGILIVGLAWMAMALRQQTGEIDALNMKMARSNVAQMTLSPALGDTPSDGTQRQIQIDKDFLVLTTDMKNEVNDLRGYNTSYANSYQLCASYMERENNINHAASRFAEGEIVYYRKLALLAEKQGCETRIDRLEKAMIIRKAADETLYLRSMDQCNRLMESPMGDGVRLRAEWTSAYDDAILKADVFAAAEKEVIACFA
jgi:hypothetical protein